ncbi:MAG TPA: anthranilate synthase component I [Pirellulaceae bacterium]|nr:anthranilate synthase component I [Pirellulaceae bacterium]HMO92911.1 anthranilate synthase component I [Pirellulaceae bacterium]HMP69189.1 anthranilate synthase component I [Pirellulaceae bacterium]
MPVTPSFTEFQEQWSKYDAIAVSRCILDDQFTPVSAFLRIDDSDDACLFESVIGGEKVGRYSFLAAGAHRLLKATRTRVDLVDFQEADQSFSIDHANPLEILREQLNRIRVAPSPNLPPFCGGAIGFAGYDVVRYVERLEHPPEDDRGIPDIVFAFYDRILVFDHINKTLNIIVLARKENFSAAEEAYADALAQIERTIQQLSTPSISEGIHEESTITDAQLNQNQIDVESLQNAANYTLEEFCEIVSRCVEYIRAGDIFQVVISQRFNVSVSVDPFQIYRHLRVLNPSPFMFYLRTGGITLVGASPEIMCRVVGREMTVRPLAGTRRRGRDEIEDMALEQELLADEKELAEHTMLVDLGRNDVGKVARFGSVKLSHAFHVERYSHVMHISSNVNGQLRDGVDALDAFMASHPAGTVSGAPKVRAMEIIDEMEKHRRGPYAGAVGYFDYSGNMDTCIALRTVVVQGSTAYLQAGAGIVADSNPISEYEETLNKAKALLRAISAAQSANPLAMRK